jgi:hypothetical protein
MDDEIQLIMAVLPAGFTCGLRFDEKSPSLWSELPPPRKTRRDSFTYV